MNGTLELGIMESLMQFLRRNEKWDEIPYLDLFFVLYRKEEWQKECGMLVLEVNDERECVGCKERKGCNLYPPVEEDLSYCVAPPRVPVVPNVPLAPPADISIKMRSSESESDGDGEKNESIRKTPLAGRTRQGRKGQKGPQLIAPLREAVGPQGERILIKVPFSPGDLVIWKQSAGSYREDPERVARVVKMVIKTQNPDWNDLQVLLDTIMDSTEKEMVIRATREKAREEIRLRQLNETVDELVPSEEPRWDPNSTGGIRAIQRYQELLVEGIRTGIPKTMNWSKLYSVKQDKNESPSAFLERLKDMARKFTNLDAEDQSGKL